VRDHTLLRCTIFSGRESGVGQNLPQTFSNAAAELASTPDNQGTKLLIFAVVYLRLTKW
jgi:hypothetical protein